MPMTSNNRMGNTKGYQMRLEGWKTTWLVAISLALIVLATIYWHGLSEESVRTILRGTARSSVILFLLAFSASSLHWLLRKTWTAWLLQNRRYIGVSFAVSHFCHLLAIIALAALFPHPFLDKLSGITLTGGGLAYVFIAAMAATSFDRTRDWLGSKRWKLLHTAGSYYIWIIFTQSYFPRAFKDGFYVPFLAALVIVMFLHMFRAFQKRAQPVRVGSDDS